MKYTTSSKFKPHLRRGPLGVHVRDLVEGLVFDKEYEAVIK